MDANFNQFLKNGEIDKATVYFVRGFNELRKQFSLINQDISSFVYDSNFRKPKIRSKLKHLFETQRDYLLVDILRYYSPPSGILINSFEYHPDLPPFLTADTLEKLQSTIDAESPCNKLTEGDLESKINSTSQFEIDFSKIPKDDWRPFYETAQESCKQGFEKHKTENLREKLSKIDGVYPEFKEFIREYGTFANDLKYDVFAFRKSEIFRGRMEKLCKRFEEMHKKYDFGAGIFLDTIDDKKVYAVVRRLVDAFRLTYIPQVKVNCEINPNKYLIYITLLNPDTIVDGTAIETSVSPYNAAIIGQTEVMNKIGTPSLLKIDYKKKGVMVQTYEGSIEPGGTGTIHVSVRAQSKYLKGGEFQQQFNVLVKQ